MVVLDTTPIGSKCRECWVWFAEKPLEWSGYDCVFYKEAYFDLSNNGFNQKKIATLWSDLSRSEDELLLAMHSGKRRDIKIAENRDFILTFGNSPEAITGYHKAQVRFALSKGIAPPLELSVLHRNADACFVAFVNDRSGGAICWNYYLLDKPVARLWYAGSDLEYGKADRGYATTIMHWKMMLYFKERGYETYDWGGVCLETEAVDSVSKFKAGFGGTRKRFYDYSVAIKVPRAVRWWRRLCTMMVPSPAGQRLDRVL